MSYIAFTQNDIVLQLQLQSKPWKLLHTITYKTQVSFGQFAWGDFHVHLLASLTVIFMKKKIQCDCQKKKYTILSSQNRHKLSIFSASEVLI